MLICLLMETWLVWYRYLKRLVCSEHCNPYQSTSAIFSGKPSGKAYKHLAAKHVDDDNNNGDEDGNNPSTSGGIIQQLEKAGEDSC